MKKLYAGFTLIELLVATAVIGFISVTSVNLLFSTVASSSKQDSITSGSEEVRSVVDIVSKSIKEAGSITYLSSTEIKVSGKTCRTIYYDSGKIRLAEDNSPSCTPPSQDPVNDSVLTSENTVIDAPGGSILPVFAKTGTVILLNLSGTSKNNLNEHKFNYSTEILQRTGI